MTSEKKLKRIEEEMYSVNAQISAVCIAMKKPLNQDQIMDLNKKIGDWIKRIREIREGMFE